jgi:hypothetical protein
VVQVMSAFGRRYGDAPQGLIESIFLPAVEYFTERRDARWINLIWFLPQERSPLSALTAAQADVVLRSLVHLRDIESESHRPSVPFVNGVCRAISGKGKGRLPAFFWRR